MIEYFKNVCDFFSYHFGTRFESLSSNHTEAIGSTLVTWGHGRINILNKIS